MPPARGNNPNKFDPSADEEVAMSLLREDANFQGTQQAWSSSEVLCDTRKPSPVDLDYSIPRELLTAPKSRYSEYYRSVPRERLPALGFQTPQARRSVIDLTGGSSLLSSSLDASTPLGRVFGSSAVSIPPRRSILGISFRLTGPPARNPGSLILKPPITHVLQFQNPFRTPEKALAESKLPRLTLFHNLPPELRKMILEATIQPRLVVVRDTKTSRDYRAGRVTDIQK